MRARWQLSAQCRLIEKRGRDGKVIDWLDELTAECPKKQARNTERSVRGAVPGFGEECCSARCASKRWRISKNGGWRGPRSPRISCSSTRLRWQGIQFARFLPQTVGSENIAKSYRERGLARIRTRVSLRDRLPCRRPLSISAITFDSVARCMCAISLRSFQKASSRLTLVLRPSMSTERFTTSEFN